MEKLRKFTASIALGPFQGKQGRNLRSDEKRKTKRKPNPIGGDSDRGDRLGFIKEKHRIRCRETLGCRNILRKLTFRVSRENSPNHKGFMEARAGMLMLMMAMHTIIGRKALGGIATLCVETVMATGNQMQR